LREGDLTQLPGDAFGRRRIETTSIHFLILFAWMHENDVPSIRQYLTA